MTRAQGHAGYSVLGSLSLILNKFEVWSPKHCSTCVLQISIFAVAVTVVVVMFLHYCPKKLRIKPKSSTDTAIESEKKNEKCGDKHEKCGENCDLFFKKFTPLAHVLFTSQCGLHNRTDHELAQNHDSAHRHHRRRSPAFKRGIVHKFRLSRIPGCLQIICFWIMAQQNQ